MPRRPTGSIESYAWKDGRTVTWRVRFRAYGRRHRLDLGTNHEGWNEDRARAELERILARVERGTWEPPTAEPDPVAGDETLHLTASRWWRRRERELAPNTRADYRWRLDYVLADLAREQTSEVTVQRVDEFRDRLAAKGLAPRSVNMILDLLAQVLDDAVEYGMLDANPARGRRRRMRVPRSSRTFLEPTMVVDLLDVAAEWEAELPAHQHYGRATLLALLCLAGPRIAEAVAADRGDFDLAAGRWRIPASKTPAGERTIELPVHLAEALRDHAAGLRSGRGPMFPTRPGGRLNPSNLRTRLLTRAVELANERRERRGDQLLPPRVTPHTLRRTFASLSFFAGRDPRFVMAQLGHADARLTLAVYAQTLKRRLTADEQAVVWRLMRFADEPESAPFGPRNDPTARKSVSEAGGEIGTR